MFLAVVHVSIDRRAQCLQRGYNAVMTSVLVPVPVLVRLLNCTDCIISTKSCAVQYTIYRNLQLVEIFELRTVFATALCECATVLYCTVSSCLHSFSILLSLKILYFVRKT